MRKDFGAKYFMYPMPVLIVGSYDEQGKADAMTAAWGSIADYTKVALFLDRNHKTVSNILAKGAFTVSMADVTNVKAADFVGIVSAKDDPDKLEKTGWTVVKSEKVDAPMFKELLMTLECKLVKWDDATEQMTGEIINVSAEESILDEKGQIDVAKLQPLVFDPVKAEYRVVGEKVAKAFNVGLELKK